MNNDITNFLTSAAYNSLNFFIFIALYFWVILYQFRLNTPSAYYISSIVDVIFCIYLIIFTRNTLITKEDSIIGFLCIFIVFGFIIVRLVAAYIFPVSFMKMGQERKNQGCKYDEMPKHIIDSVFRCKTLYLYSTILILLLFYMVLFWGDKINDNTDFMNTQSILNFDSKVYITYFIIIANIVLSTLHVHYVSKFYKEVNRTTMCPPSPEENIWNEFDVDVNKLIDKPEFKQILIKAGISTSSGTQDETVEYIFPRYDKDEDGYLNYEEYKDFYKDYFGIPVGSSSNIATVPNIEKQKTIATRHYTHLWNKYKQLTKIYYTVQPDPNQPATQVEADLDLFREEKFSKLLRELQLANDKYSTRSFLKHYGNRRILNPVDSTEGDYTMGVTEFYNFYDKYVDKLNYNTTNSTNPLDASGNEIIFDESDGAINDFTALFKKED